MIYFAVLQHTGEQNTSSSLQVRGATFCSVINSKCSQRQPFQVVLLFHFVAHVQTPLVDVPEGSCSSRWSVRGRTYHGKCSDSWELFNTYRVR